MESLATLHILCLNLVPCKFEIQFNLTEWLSWNVCCHPAYRNFLPDSWFDPWVGQRRQNQEAAWTKGFKVYNASIKNTTSPQGHPKSSFVAKCLSSVHNVCWRLMALHTLGQFRRGRVLPRGVCHHVIDIFLFVFFSDPSIFPQLVCGRVHFDKDDQLSTIKGVDMNLNMHFGTSSSLLLVISFTAAVFEASFRQIWAQRFLRWNTLAKQSD